MRLWTGTSGYSYKEWKGLFYPEDLPAAEMLRFYAERLPAVEINNTFYRMPTEKLLAGWASQVPDGFRFVLKAPQRITHKKKLEGAADDVAYLMRTAETLGPKLGVVLFQLPPYLRKDLDRLAAFVADLPAGTRAAFEFRHPSWLDEEVYQILLQAGCSLCAADIQEGLDAPLLDGTWGYLRLRRVEYDDEALEAWAERILARPWEEAYVFFKHEEEATGPRLAMRFAEIFEG